MPKKVGKKNNSPSRWWSPRLKDAGNRVGIASRGSGFAPEYDLFVVFKYCRKTCDQKNKNVEFCQNELQNEYFSSEIMSRAGFSFKSF